MLIVCSNESNRASFHTALGQSTRDRKAQARYTVCSISAGRYTKTPKLDSQESTQTKENGTFATKSENRRGSPSRESMQRCHGLCPIRQLQQLGCRCDCVCLSLLHVCDTFGGALHRRLWSLQHLLNRSIKSGLIKRPAKKGQSKSQALNLINRRCICPVMILQNRSLREMKGFRLIKSKQRANAGQVPGTAVGNMSLFTVYSCCHCQ